MAQQQAEPRAEAFGLQSDIQMHVPEEDHEQPQAQQQRSERHVTTKAVNRRGPNQQRAATDVEDRERDEDQADLDASQDNPDNDPDGDADDLLAKADGDLDDDENEGDDGDDREDDADRRARKDDSNDSRSRRQLREALNREAQAREELQRRLDGMESRLNQSQQQRTQADADEADDPLDDMLQELVPEPDELASPQDKRARTTAIKQAKRLIQERERETLNSYAREEAQAIMAIPGMRQHYNTAVQSGLIDRLRHQHQNVGPLMVATLMELHQQEIKNLEKKHANALAKDRKRRANLAELPPGGQGNRGSRDTGRGRNNGRQSPMEAAMASISAKYGGK
jgi:hypothetical protein